MMTSQVISGFVSENDSLPAPPKVMQTVYGLANLDLCDSSAHYVQGRVFLRSAGRLFVLHPESHVGVGPLAALWGVRLEECHIVFPHGDGRRRGWKMVMMSDLRGYKLLGYTDDHWRALEHLHVSWEGKYHCYSPQERVEIAKRVALADGHG